MPADIEPLLIVSYIKYSIWQEFINTVLYSMYTMAPRQRKVEKKGGKKEMITVEVKKEIIEK